MKLPRHIQLIALAWLAMSSATVQASYFECPVGEVCSYASSQETSPGFVTHLPGDGASGDITGGPLYDPTIGLVLAAPASDPSPDSFIIAEFLNPIYQTAWIVTDELVTPAELDERMEIFASTDNGSSYTSLGTYFNRNANDLTAGIDLTSISSLLNPVTHLKIMGINPDIDIGCVIMGGTDCTTFDNAMEVLGVAGIMAPEVSSVPVPAAIWLFGSGLVGLLGIARRRRK